MGRQWRSWWCPGERERRERGLGGSWWHLEERERREWVVEARWRRGECGRRGRVCCAGGERERRRLRDRASSLVSGQSGGVDGSWGASRGAAWYWGVGLGWVKASHGRLPTVRAAFPAGPDWAAVPGCPVTRPTGLLTAPRPRGGARGRVMPPCLCVCALVCLRGGGGGLAHLLAPWLFGVGAHGVGKCVPGAPGPGREAGEPDSEPAGGDVGLGSQPQRY